MFSYSISCKNGNLTILTYTMHHNGNLACAYPTRALLSTPTVSQLIDGACWTRFDNSFLPPTFTLSFPFCYFFVYNYITIIFIVRSVLVVATYWLAFLQICHSYGQHSRNESCRHCNGQLPPVALFRQLLGSQVKRRRQHQLQ